MNRKEARIGLISVATGYAAISCITQDGELVFKRGFPTGTHDLAPLALAMGEYDTLEIPPEVDVFIKQSRVQRMAYGQGATDSGANPDFKITSATRNAREAALMMARLTEKMSTLERRTAQLDALERRTNQRVDKQTGSDSVQLVDGSDDQTPSEESTISRAKDNEVEPNV